MEELLFGGERFVVLFDYLFEGTFREGIIVDHQEENKLIKIFRKRGLLERDAVEPAERKFRNYVG